MHFSLMGIMRVPSDVKRVATALSSENSGVLFSLCSDHSIVARGSVSFVKKQVIMTALPIPLSLCAATLC